MINAKLREARRASVQECSDKGMSKAEAARHLGLSSATISRYSKDFGTPFEGPAARLAAITKLAEAGKTRQEAAEEVGLTYHSVVRLALKHGIKFKHASEGVGVDHSRAEAMAAMYRGGKTLEDIGRIFGVTRERVRQIVKKHHGLTGSDGGLSARASRKRSAREAERDAKCLQEHGCTFDQLRQLRKLAREQIAAGIGQYRTPIKAFINQRNSAKARGIEWKLKLWDWWTIWQESGKWGSRGRGKGYMMCRFGDTGPYEVGNVYIATGVHNGTFQPNNPYRASHPDFKEAIARIRGRAEERRCSVQGCDAKHYAHGLCQKHYGRRRYEEAKTCSSEERREAA